MLLQFVQTYTLVIVGFDILFHILPSPIYVLAITANLFEILICYSFLISSSFSSFSFLTLNIFPIKILCCFFTYCQSFPNFCNHQILISITVSTPENLYIEYTRMPSPVCHYVIKLVLSLPIRRGPGVFMNVSVCEYCAINN